MELLDEQERTEFARLENSLEYARVMLSDKQYLDFKIEIEYKLELLRENNKGA